MTDTRHKYKPMLSRQEAIRLLQDHGLSKHTLEQWCSLPAEKLSLPAGQVLRLQVTGMTTHKYRRDSLLHLCQL